MVFDRIKLLNKTVYKLNKKGKESPSDMLNIHHLRPVWANGLDIELNYFVVPPGHQKPRSAKTLAQLKKSQIRKGFNIDKKNQIIVDKKGSPILVKNIHDWWAYKIWSYANKKGVLHKTHKRFLNCAKPEPRVKLGTYTENTITDMAKKLSLADPPIDIY